MLFRTFAPMYSIVDEDFQKDADGNGHGTHVA